MTIIKGIYETHLEVKNLEKSVDFYKALGLSLGHVDLIRRAAFLYIYGDQEYMIGLWEKAEVHSRHFAFRVAHQDVSTMYPFLETRGIQPAFGFLEVMVSPSGPDAQLYFHDPDGNELELISRLPELARPEIKQRWIPLSEWRLGS